jgi:hypothetical protein
MVLVYVIVIEAGVCIGMLKSELERHGDIIRNPAMVSIMIPLRPQASLSAP